MAKNLPLIHEEKLSKLEELTLSMFKTLVKISASVAKNLPLIHEEKLSKLEELTLSTFKTLVKISAFAASLFKANT